MKLSDKAQASLQAVVGRFQQGDLSPIVHIVRLHRSDDESPMERWSFSNQILAYLQTGDLDCRGYRQWEASGRNVKPGSHAAFILAPCTITKEDDDGDKETVIVGFRGIPVFGISATDGAPLPVVDYAPTQLPPLADVAARMGIRVDYTPTPGGILGSCGIDGTDIALGTHDASVFFHELAHAAHARVQGGRNKGGQHADQETTAELTACMLMHLYGLGDRTGNAWQYIKGYNSDPLKAIVSALSTVEKVLVVLGILDKARDKESIQ